MLPVRQESLACAETDKSKGLIMKIIAWIVGIIFLIGLLVVTGILKLIF